MTEIIVTMINISTLPPLELISGMFQLTLTCPRAMVIAAADVKALMTGKEMKFTRMPANRTTVLGVALA